MAYNYRMGKRYSCLILFLWLIPLGLAQSTLNVFLPANPPGGIGGACSVVTLGYLTPAGQVVTCVSSVWTVSAGSSGGTVTSIATTTPITGGTFTTTGTIACPTCGVTGSPLSQFAATTSAQLASVISDESGTGVLVFNTSPTFITPALGTPASGVLANATGLPVSTGISGLGSGIATFLATASSANLLSALTTKTGTGLVMFGTSPTASGLTLSDVATGTQCLHANGSGVVSGTGSDCGSGAGSGTVTSVVIAPTAPITVSGTCTITTSGTCTIAAPTAVTSASALGNTQIMTGAGSQASQTPSSAATVDTSGNILATSVGTGTSPPSSSVCTAGTAGMFCGAEGTTPTGTLSAVGVIWSNSSTHRLDMINGGANTQIVAAGVDVNTSDQVTVTHLSSSLPVNQGGTGAATLTGPIKGNGTSALSAAAAADIVGLFSTCSGSQYLGADGACHNASGAGTVTSVIIAPTGPITVSGTCTITTSGTCTIAAPTAVTSAASLPAGGLVYGTAGTQATAATAAGTAKQIAISGGAGAPSFIDLPDAKDYPSANCVSSVGGSAWDTTLTAGCIGGSNNLGGELPFVDGSIAQFKTHLPRDWDTATQPYIELQFTSATNTSGTMIFQVQTACYKLDGSTTTDPTFATAQVFSTATAAAASRGWEEDLQLNAVTSGNSCVANGQMLVKITRNTDTAGSAVFVTGATITTPRLPAVQAN